MSKKGKKDKNFTIRVEEELLERYKKAIGGNVSNDIREYMRRKTEQKTSLSELERKRVEITNKINTLEFELKEIDEEIEEAKAIKEENNKNEELLEYCIETVENLIYTSPNNAISREKVEDIAKKKNLEPILLIKACKSKGIVFSTTTEESLNSILRDSKEEEEKPPNTKLYKRIKMKYGNEKHKSIEKYLAENEEDCLVMADKYGANYDEVKEMLINVYSKKK